MHIPQLRYYILYTLMLFNTYYTSNAALQLPKVAIKQAEILDPPQELEAVLRTYINVTALRTIIYDYVRASEIHDDHAKFIRFICDRVQHYGTDQFGPEFKFVDTCMKKSAPNSYYDGEELDNCSIDEICWFALYINQGLENSFKIIEYECNKKKSFFTGDFKDFVQWADATCIEQLNKYLLESLLPGASCKCDDIESQRTWQKTAKLLIAHQAPVNAYLRGQSITPLSIAINHFKNPDLVELVLTNKADPNYCCGFQGSYLHQTAKSFYPRIVQLLLQAKADPDQQYNFPSSNDPLMSPLEWFKHTHSLLLDIKKPFSVVQHQSDLNILARLIPLLQEASQKHKQTGLIRYSGQA